MPPFGGRRQNTMRVFASISGPTLGCPLPPWGMGGVKPPDPLGAMRSALAARSVGIARARPRPIPARYGHVARPRGPVARPAHVRIRPGSIRGRSGAGRFRHRAADHRPIGAGDRLPPPCGRMVRHARRGCSARPEPRWGHRHPGGHASAVGHGPARGSSTAARDEPAHPSRPRVQTAPTSFLHRARSRSTRQPRATAAARWPHPNPAPRARRSRRRCSAACRQGHRRPSPGRWPLMGGRRSHPCSRGRPQAVRPARNDGDEGSAPKPQSSFASWPNAGRAGPRLGRHRPRPAARPSQPRQPPRRPGCGAS